VQPFVYSRRVGRGAQAGLAKSGLTLVELLVVVAIIGTLIAILLPAVQSAQESAKRSRCQNQLKQVGLALLNYHDAKKQFPPGQSSATGFAWGTYIMPFMELTSLYAQLDLTQSIGSTGTTPTDWVYTGNAVLGRGDVADVPQARCPSAKSLPAAVVLNWSFNAAQPYALKNLAVGSYQGNGGPWDTSATCAWNDARFRGVFADDSRIRLNDILDGTSKTMLVGENRYVEEDAGGDGTGGWFGWCNVTSGSAQPSTPGDQNRRKLFLRWCEKSINQVDANNWQRNYNFGSMHGTGAHFVFCDGAVRFLSETIQHTTTAITTNGATIAAMGLYQKLSARNDGAVVSDFGE